MINKVISLALAVVTVSAIIALLFVVIPILSFLLLCLAIGGLLVGLIWFLYEAIQEELDEEE